MTYSAFLRDWRERTAVERPADARLDVGGLVDRATSDLDRREPLCVDGYPHADGSAERDHRNGFSESGVATPELGAADLIHAQECTPLYNGAQV